MRGRVKTRGVRGGRQFINKVYHNVKSEGGFSGVSRFARAANLNLNEAREILKNSNAYTLHKPARRRYPTPPTISHGVDNTWQLDLADLTKFSAYNNGVKYLIFAIDTYSRHAWVRPLKTKSGEEVAEAIFDIFKTSGRIPGLIWTDFGKEFYNRHVQRVMNELGIKLYFTGGPNKASMVERLLRTFKERLYRYFTYTRSYKYIHALNDFLTSYNSSIHRVTGSRPIDINRDTLLVRPSLKPLKTKHKFKVGETVRINKLKRLFAKGAEQSWTNEVFIIDSIVPNKSVSMYALKDSQDCVIKGSFVDHELQAINKLPESVIRYRKP